ncbi:MAG: hypothetical protein ACK4FS_07655, partial [Flavobacterium sp.]
MKNYYSTFLKKILLLFIFVIGGKIVNAQQTFTNFQSASLVVGQSNFTTTSAACTQVGLNGPSYVAISSKGVLAVVEQTGGRVKIWNNSITANGTPADVVLGKPNFNTCGTSSSPTQSLTQSVNGVAFTPDGNKLIISDSSNNRVLIWNSIPTTSGQNADVVLGQPNYITGTSGTSSTKFNVPTGVFVSNDGKLIVADHYNSRVLIWNTVPTI